MAVRAALVLTVALIAGPPTRTGGDPVRAVRVAVLLSQDTPPYREVVRGFSAALSEGGRAVTIDVHVLETGATARRTVERLRGSVDLVLALGSPATRMATSTLRGTPIIAGMVLKASELSGDNTTGVFLEFPPDVEFRWLRRLLPGASRIGVLYNAAENGRIIRDAEKAAVAGGLRLQAREVGKPSDIPRQLSSLENDASVLWGLADSIALTPETARPMLLFSLRNRIPFFGISEAWVRAGALYALDRDYVDVGRQCGEIAVRVLNGEAPRSIRPQPPRKVEYVVSQRAAEMLGITIPADVLRGAKAVFE